MTAATLDRIAELNGIDMSTWRDACEAEMFDNSGMPIVHYPGTSYARVLAALGELQGQD